MFVGLKNYTTMFQTSYYWEAWKNSFVFLFLQLLMTFFIPIIQALFLNELRRISPVIQKQTYMMPDGTYIHQSDLNNEELENLVTKWRQWSYYKLRYKDVG